MVFSKPPVSLFKNKKATYHSFTLKKFSNATFNHFKKKNDYFKLYMANSLLLYQRNIQKYISSALFRMRLVPKGYVSRITSSMHVVKHFLNGLTSSLVIDLNNRSCHILCIFM